jgi:hypothetical protein
MDPWRAASADHRGGALFDVWADFLVMAAAGIFSFCPLAPIGASFAVFIATSGMRPTMYDPVGQYIGGIVMAGFSTSSRRWTSSRNWQPSNPTVVIALPHNNRKA